MNVMESVSIHVLLKLIQNIQYSFSKAEIHKKKKVKNKQHIKNKQAKQNDQKKKVTLL